MLDTTAVRVYKYLAVNSSGGVFKGRISEIVSATGLSRVDILEALSHLEEEKYVQVVHSPANLANLVELFAGALLRAEAGYIEALRRLTQTSLEDAKITIKEEKERALKYLSGTEYEELLAVDVTAVLRELESLNRMLAKALSHYVDSNPSSALGEPINLDNSAKYLRRLEKLIDIKNKFTDEDNTFLATVLSVFIEIPVKEKTIMESSHQQLMKKLEDLEQSLEEVEARILIEGATSELVDMRMRIKNQIDSLRRSLTSTGERKVYFIEKSEIPQLLSSLDSRETFLSCILEGLRTASDNPFSAKVRTALANVLELLRIEREILKKLEQKIA